jgi:hypothetical protein
VCRRVPPPHTIPLVDDYCGGDVRKFASLPGLHLLTHRFKVPLHPVHPDRKRVVEREALRVFRQDRREHTRGNVSDLGCRDNVTFNRLEADLWGVEVVLRFNGKLPVGGRCKGRWSKNRPPQQLGGTSRLPGAPMNRTRPSWRVLYHSGLNPLLPVNPNRRDWRSVWQLQAAA